MKKYTKNLLIWVISLVVVLGAIVPVNAYGLTYKGAPSNVSFDEEYYSRFKGENRSINVYNWGEYIADGSDGLVDVCKAFTEITGIKVYYTNFATNEELYAKLKSGATNYDVIIPSDYMIARMIEEDMLASLDKSNIPNFKYIEERFMDPEYDPASKYSIPYAWNVVAIIYNKKLVHEVPTSWDVLWDERYKSQILMFANSRDAMAIACKKLGYSLNTENPEELRAAANLLIEQKPLVQAYVMDQIFDKMENGEAALAPYYAGDATLMVDSNPNLAVAYPVEGTNIFVDAACIPKDAPEKECAEMFINFLNEPNIAAENMEFIGYATPNWAGYELLPKEIQNSEIIYPNQAVLDNSEQFIHLSKEANLLLDELWTEIMAESQTFWQWGFPPIVVLLFIIAGKIGFKINKARRYKKMIED